MDPRLKAIVFEAEGRVWSAPVSHAVLLTALSDEQLQELLKQALSRG